MSGAAESRVATAYARTREHLAYLGLATASECLALELERATTEKAAPVEVLERLLAAEVEATSARRLSGRLRFAHYPLDKRLAQFEFDFQPSIDRSVIAELSTLRFVEEHRNALFLGPPGVGKSHLAIALGIAATEAGYRTYFTTAADLVGSLNAAHLEGSWTSKMRTYTGPSVLVIDELGYLPLERSTAHLFFQLVARRYERGSVLLTTNQPVTDWGHVFGDETIAAAILDRLLHHSHTLVIKEESYRLKSKKRAGLLGHEHGTPGWVSFLS